MSYSAENQDVYNVYKIVYKSLYTRVYNLIIKMYTDLYTKSCIQMKNELSLLPCLRF
jgi:hypothetical protein